MSISIPTTLTITGDIDATVDLKKNGVSITDVYQDATDAASTLITQTNLSNTYKTKAEADTEYVTTSTIKVVPLTISDVDISFDTTDTSSLVKIEGSMVQIGNQVVVSLFAEFTPNTSTGDLILTLPDLEGNPAYSLDEHLRVQTEDIISPHGDAVLFFDHTNDTDFVAKFHRHSVDSVVAFDPQTNLLSPNSSKRWFISGILNAIS